MRSYYKGYIRQNDSGENYVQGFFVVVEGGNVNQAVSAFNIDVNLSKKYHPDPNIPTTSIGNYLRKKLEDTVLDKAMHPNTIFEYREIFPEEKDLLL
jgi:hypothetical protein